MLPGERTLSFERAPAKINLTLHVLGRRADGFHDLQSLVAFSCFGDVLTLDTTRQSHLAVSGPRAAFTGPLEDNLVLKAAHELQAQAPDLRTGGFHLIKSLPAAAGIGGGSSDAAAALRLLARANGMAADDSRVREAAARTGSDVPVCLRPRARMMRGTGDVLGPQLQLPPLHGLLVNPGVALETKTVFAEMGEMGEMGLKPGAAFGFGKHPEIASGLSFDGLVSQLKRARNDMEDAASVLAPVIGHVLSVIGAARGCKLARMSGSGATCFGLFETRLAASRAARVIRRDHPGWWVKACVLR